MSTRAHHPTRDVGPELLRESEDGPTLVTLPALAQSDWVSRVTSVAIIRLDAAGCVRTWNPGAERIHGYPAAEILGESFERFYRPQERERDLPAALLERAARRGSSEDTGWRVRADGGLFWAHVVITAMRDENARLTGYVKMVRDLTAAKRQEQQRTAFLRAFVHDFLSPITALRGYADLLQEAAPEHRALVDRVSIVSEHLVDMMAELSGYLQGANGAHVEPVDVAALMREAGELVLPGPAFKRLRVSTDGSCASTNAAVLRRAFANVLDNAAKYSEDRIHVSIAADGGDVAVRVRDRGRGIAPEDLPTIFEPGARGRLAAPEDGGSGVGLASVRDIVERLGGRVSIDSELGIGTTVTLRLPLADPAAPPRA